MQDVLEDFLLATAREKILTVFALGVPNTFNRALLSTNGIENRFRNMRRLLGARDAMASRDGYRLKMPDLREARGQNGISPHPGLPPNPSAEPGAR